jgi:signal transduction histidine kinase/sensor domain CHASE-containing protein
MKEKKYLSVRSKVLLTIGVSIVVLFGLMYVISTQVLSKSYLSIERDAVIQNLGRANDAIQDVVSNQYLHLNDWSPWDELYTYAEEPYLEFEEDTLFAEGIIRQDQNSLFLTDTEGGIFFAKLVDLKTETELASSSFVAFLKDHKKLIIHEDIEDSIRGLLMFPEGPALIVSKPILHNDNTGPVIGSVSIMRYIDAEKIENLGKITHLTIDIYPVDGAAIPEDVLEAKKVLSKENPYVVTPVSSNLIRGYRLLYDVYDKPMLVLRVETPRPVYTQGQSTLLFFMVIGGIALLLFALGMTGLLEKLVIRRFVGLTRDVEKINTEKDISIRVRAGVEDDMGKLAGKINQMLVWLSASRDAEAKSKKEIVLLLEDIKHGKEKAEEMVVQRTHELSEEKARLIASINSLSFGFVIADTENTIILRNPALSSILQIEEIPRSLEDIATVFQKKGTTEDSFNPLSLVREVVEHKKIAEQKEISFGKKFLRFLCAPIFAEDGPGSAVSTDVIGYVFVVEDITEAKNMERSREEFFSIASHELRTPLTAIRWNTDMLLSLQKTKKESTDTKEMLQDIHNSSVRLIGIVADFLEVSRLEQGKVKVMKEALDIFEVVQKTVRSLQEMADKKSLSLTVQAPGENVSTKVLGDVSRIEQVLDNLIGNALKFTEKGNVTVSMEPLGSFLKVSVSDTGVGISTHNQTRLFKKFQQAGEDMLARDVNQSTGLGLYIAKLIMTAMGGAIALEKSVLGEGSTFTFTLPLAPPGRA